MENVMKMVTGLLKWICLVVSVGLVIIGQKSVGYQGLCTMIAGLSGIMLLLYLYNRKYK